MHSARVIAGSLVGSAAVSEVTVKKPAEIGQGEPGSGLSWVKSSLSMATGDCVEVAMLPDGGAAVRDSKDRGGAVLRFTPDEWLAFLGGVRNGEFDNFG
jgi:Domain of unknown function (DUF397)